MKKISVGEKQRRKSVYAYVRSESHRQLLCGTGLLKFILAVLITGVFAAFTLYSVDLCSLFYESGVLRLSPRSQMFFVTCLQCIILFFGFYLVFCFAVGTFCMAGCGAEGKDISLDTVITPLKSRRNAVTSLFLYFYFLLIAFLCFLPYLCIRFFVPAGLFKTGVLKTSACVFSVVFGVILFGIFLFKKAAVPAVLIHSEQKSVKNAIKISSRAMKKHIFSCFVLTLGQIPLIIISILSLGILFIIYTVPLFYTLYAVFGSYAYGCYSYGGKEVKNGE